MKSLSQTHNFALDWSGYRVIVYATVLTMELEPGVYYHTLTEFSHALTPTSRFKRLLWSVGVRVRVSTIDALVRQWFCDEYSYFSAMAKEHYKL